MTTASIIELRTNQAAANLGRIPARFAADIPATPELATWITAYTTNDTAPSIAISGPTGVGKTHQAYQAIRSATRARAKLGRPTRWLATNHPDLNASQRPGGDTTPAAHLARLAAVDLLFIDDIGAGKQTDWTADTLYRLVDTRWANQLTTIYATNLTPAQLTATLGDRVASRIAAATQIVIKGGDRRWTSR